VLPFGNLSGDPAQDYFADGITENLTTELSRIKDSFVIARNKAFAYKSKPIDAREIGKELGVRYVLEGSVQRDQNRVRVNAQLIDSASGAHLWADRFEPWPTCSSCKMKSSHDWPAVWARRGPTPKRERALVPIIRTSLI
jgi:TolB-like protein